MTCSEGRCVCPIQSSRGLLEVGVSLLDRRPVHSFLRLSSYLLNRRQVLLYLRENLSFLIGEGCFNAGRNQWLYSGRHFAPLGVHQRDGRLLLFVEEIFGSKLFWRRGGGWSWSGCLLTARLRFYNRVGQRLRVDRLLRSKWRRSFVSQQHTSFVRRNIIGRLVARVSYRFYRISWSFLGDLVYWRRRQVGIRLFDWLANCVSKGGIEIGFSAHRC